MSIQALPQTAVRALGATQAITGPVSIVKELLDNALDARATSITIEISSNTLDIIQVRDNGHGIASEDRHLAAKRYCTSKIRDEQDLVSVGGSSLGFRGEALSSAVEMSSSMTITTKVEGESVACMLKVNRDGTLADEQKTSHPVGTTVRLTDFLRPNPVRRNRALKDAVRSLASVKQTLQAYAFARPATRLSLQVLKSKNRKDDWVYAGKEAASFEEVAIKVVGKACASQCSTSQLERHGFTMQGLLPMPTAEVSKISGVGQHISVDARPMSTSRGVGKQIANIFRQSFKQAHANFEGMREPFMALRLTCPCEAYDANIEPAKDDVLFIDQDKILDVIKAFFNSVYATDMCVPHRRTAASQSDAGEHDGSAAEPACHTELSTTLHTPGIFSSNMFDRDTDEDTVLLSRSMDTMIGSHDEESPEALRHISVSSPWTIAKVNSFQGPPPMQLRTPARLPSAQTRFASPLKSSAVPALSPPRDQGLPTPDPSSPVRPYMETVDQPIDDTMTNYCLSEAQPYMPLADGQVSNRRVSRTNTTYPRQSLMEETSLLRKTNPPRPQTLPITIPETRAGLSLDMIPNAPQRRSNGHGGRQLGRVNKPFKPQVPKERDAWFDIPQARENRQTRRQPRQILPEVDTSTLYPQAQLGDNSEFPQRLAAPARNTDIRSFLSEPVASSELSNADIQGDLKLAKGDQRQAVHPAKNNEFVRASDIAGRTDNQENVVVQSKYSQRRRTSERRALVDINGNGDVADVDVDVPLKARRITRTKSSQLALERTPAYAQMQNVIVPTSQLVTDIERFQRAAETTALLGWNETSSSYRSTFQSPIEDALTRAWADQLALCLQKRYRPGDMIQDPQYLLRGALQRVLS